MQNPTPTTLHFLGALRGVLEKGQAFCAEREIEETVLLNARLAPDMWNLAKNVIASCDLSKMQAARLTQTEPPAFEENINSFADLYDYMDRTIAFVTSIPDSAYEDAEDRVIKMKARGQEIEMSADGYLSRFSLPNFYFHATTAYDILRHNGVALGKMDFLGGM